MDGFKFFQFLMAIVIGAAIIAVVPICIHFGERDGDKYQEYYPQFQISGSFSIEPNLYRVHKKNEVAESTVFKWDIDISVRNPNKYFENYYKDFQVMVRGNNKVLAEYRFPSFWQRAKNTTFLHASFSKSMPDFSSLFPTQQYEIRFETLFGNNERYNFPCTLLINCDPFDAATGGALKPCLAHCNDEGLVDRPYWH